MVPQSVAKTYHQDEPRKARRARAKLSILDIVHKPLHSLERVKILAKFINLYNNHCLIGGATFLEKCFTQQIKFTD